MPEGFRGVEAGRSLMVKKAASVLWRGEEGENEDYLEVEEEVVQRDPAFHLPNRLCWMLELMLSNQSYPT